MKLKTLVLATLVAGLQAQNLLADENPATVNMPYLTLLQNDPKPTASSLLIIADPKSDVREIYWGTDVNKYSLEESESILGPFKPTVGARSPLAGPGRVVQPTLPMKFYRLVLK